MPKSMYGKMGNKSGGKMDRSMRNPKSNRGLFGNGKHQSGGGSMGKHSGGMGMMSKKGK